MEFVQILFLILIWILPIYFMINAYLKMDEEKREELKSELRNPLILFVSGFVGLGVLLFSTGSISTVKLLQHIGMTMIFISWFTIIIVSWKRKKTGFITSVSLVLLGLVGIAAYEHLI